MIIPAPTFVVALHAVLTHVLVFTPMTFIHRVMAEVEFLTTLTPVAELADTPVDKPAEFLPGEIFLAVSPLLVR